LLYFPCVDCSGGGFEAAEVSAVVLGPIEGLIGPPEDGLRAVPRVKLGDAAGDGDTYGALR